MANVIKLKRGTSTPTTSDIVNGEVAIDTSAQKFYVNDGGTVKEIGGGASSGVSDGSITTAKLADDAVTYAKMQNVSATDRILGRDSSGAGIIEEITPANLRTMINVENGATADQTASEIKTLLQSNQLTSSEIATNAIGTTNISAGAITNSLLGSNAVETAKIADTAVTYAKIQNVSATNRILGRDSSGAGSIEEITPANLRTMINVEDGATADQTASDIRGLGFFDTSNDGSGSGLDSDLLDGQQGSYYLNYNNFSNTPTIPTFTSQLNNNSNFITSSGSISGSSGSCTGNAATATKLQTARTIAGASFDGSANISISYNNLTNKPTIPTDTNNYVSDASISGTTLSLTRSGLSTLTVNGIVTTSTGTATNSSALATKTLTASGSGFDAVPLIGSDGVIEVGKYMDFHNSGSDNWSGSGDSGDHTGGRITSTTGNFIFSRGITAAGVALTSDRNIKNSIQDSDLGLDFINLLKPVSYKYNHDDVELAFDSDTHYGLIAQDVEDVITGLGKTISDISMVQKPTEKTLAGTERPMNLDYIQFIAVLIKAVQELSAKVETIQSKVS